mgnify:CR=1 FL=1|jgi:hypothetical protein
MQSGSNTEHSILSPSGSKKWLNCAASLVVEQDYPNESGQAAINGTAMHTVSEVVLNRIINEGADLDARTYKGAYVEDEGKGKIRAHVKPPKGGVLVNDDMVKQCNSYIDHWRPLLNVCKFVQLEMRVDLTRILHKGATVTVTDPRTGEKSKAEVQTFGTADMVMLVPQSDGTFLLIVGDLKTGRHKVHAKENKQLMLYALGVLRKLRRLYDISMVRLVIFQPYCGGADEWDITPDGLDIFAKFASKRALAAIDALEKGKKGLKPADFKPSADACEWCRFANDCGARAKAAIATLRPSTATDDDLADTADNTEASPEEIANHERNMERKARREARKARREARKARREKRKPDQYAMTPEELKVAYDDLDMMRQHIKRIEDAVFKAVLQGEGKTLGLKMVAGKEGNRAWGDKDAVLDMLTKSRVKKDLFIKESLFSPADAEKVLKDEKPAVWAKLQAQIKRAPAKPTLAPIDDPRPEWSEATDEDLE